MKITIGRRSAALIATGALTLTGAGIAHAGIQNEYMGNAKGQPESTVGFDINRSQGKRVVENITFFGQTNCDAAGQDQQTFGQGMGRIRIGKGGVFEGQRKATTSFDQTGDSGTLTISGKRVRKGVVRGTLRLKETRSEGDVEVDRCNTGALDFRVTKQQMGQP